MSKTNEQKLAFWKKCTLFSSIIAASVFASSMFIINTIHSEEMPSDEAIQHTVNNNLYDKFKGLGVVSTHQIEGTSFYLMKASNGMTLYTDKSGSNLLINNREGTPTLFNITGSGGPKNLTEEVLIPYNREIMGNSQNIVEGALHKADNEKARVYVFIDPACGYCHKFNEQMNTYLSSGISIEYMPFPIFGPRSEEILYRVWSLPPEERAAALDKAQSYLIKNPHGNDIDAIGLPPATQKGKDLVEKYKMKARLLGFSGTPGIYLKSGELVKGYVPATELAKTLSIK